MLTIEYEDTIFKVGKNSKENWELLEESQEYMWFHLDSFPSCYVICCDENPSNECLIYGAQLCKLNTKYRNLKNIKVNYTKLSNLIKGKEEGSVFIKSKRKVQNMII